MQTKQLGSQGENLAREYLLKLGLKILQQNLRTKFGEIDILAQDGQTIVVVEVKAKTSGRRGKAIEMITPAKQKKLLLLAQEMQVKYKREAVRIDAVSIDQIQGEPVINYYKGVVENNG